MGEGGRHHDFEDAVTKQVGPRIGRFVLSRIPPGEAPEEHRAAFVGLALPVRRILLESVTRGADPALMLALSSNDSPVLLPIHGLDAIGTLHVAGKETEVVYWMAEGWAEKVMRFPAHYGEFTPELPEPPAHGL